VPGAGFRSSHNFSFKMVFRQRIADGSTIQTVYDLRRCYVVPTLGLFEVGLFIPALEGLERGRACK